MKTLSLKLPDALDVKIAALAAQRRSSKSEVIRSVLEAYLADRGTTATASALDLAGDLVGSLEGENDLSHSREHMRGYGENESERSRNRGVLQSYMRDCKTLRLCGKWPPGPRSDLPGP
jgi:Arc/MetJ-type ribon-helix-helix transcriptional regulator